MARVLAGALIALIISLVVGPFFIRFLRERAYGQQIREEGPQHHIGKQGTPTMGGVLIVAAASVAVLITTVWTLPALTIFGTMLACGAIGFADDLIKLRHRRSLGLSARWKMLLLLAIALVVCAAAHHQKLKHDVFVPILNHWIPLGWGWYVLVFVIIAGAANAVNLTDGLDGLASGTSIIALFTLTAMAVTIYIRQLDPTGHRIQTRLDAAFVGAAVIGAAIGFLWFNAWPAEVFMGDTGAMALGGAMAAMAIFLKVELLLLLVGGVFVIEALSVMIQVVAYKVWGVRPFLMAPIHHHFEFKEPPWSETKIMVRFWIVAGILCAAGFALFYKYYPQIRPG